MKIIPVGKKCVIDRRLQKSSKNYNNDYCCLANIRSIEENDGIEFIQYYVEYYNHQSCCENFDELMLVNGEYIESNALEIKEAFVKEVHWDSEPTAEMRKYCNYEIAGNETYFVFAKIIAEELIIELGFRNAHNGYYSHTVRMIDGKIDIVLEEAEV